MENKKEKECSQCYAIRPMEDFHKDAKDKYGRSHRCKFCASIYVRNRNINDPRISMLNNAKQRVDKQGLSFDITIEDLVIPDNCPILGIPLIRAVGVRG